MPRVVRTASMEEDLFLIWNYIREDNEAAADRIVRMIDEKFLLLAQHPRLGPARSDLAADLRYFPVGSYLIFYREIADGVEIIRVLHGARNMEALFQAGEHY